ncbi:hypothetical protein Tco_1465346 [Tanacetum coccineum]
MSAMANTNPIVATVTKPATKKKTPKDADATPRFNIQDFCEEHYEDIMSLIMDKIRRGKEVPYRPLDLGYRNSSERHKVRDRLKDNAGNVFGRLVGTLPLAGDVQEVETAPWPSKVSYGNTAPPTDHEPDLSTGTALEGTLEVK